MRASTPPLFSFQSPADVPAQLPDGLSLAGFYEAYYRRLFLAGGSAGNQQIYRIALRYWLFLMGPTQLIDLAGAAGRAKLLSFRARLLEATGLAGRPLARHTINWIVRTISALLSRAGPRGLDWLAVPPGPVPALKTIKREPRLYTLAELEALYEACGSIALPRIAGLDAAAWWRALLATAYGTALRRGALLHAAGWSPAGARWRDVDWRRKTLRVVADKTGDERQKPLRAEVIEHLAALKSGEEWLFAWRHGQRAFRQSRHAIWQAAGLDLSALGKPFHALRKTALTAIGVGYQEAVHAAMRVADHAADRTTRDWYLGGQVERRALELVPWPAGWSVTGEAWPAGWIIRFPGA